MPIDNILAPKPCRTNPLSLAIGDYLLTLTAEGKSPKTLCSVTGVLDRFNQFTGPIDPLDAPELVALLLENPHDPNAVRRQIGEMMTHLLRALAACAEHAECKPVIRSMHLTNIRYLMIEEFVNHPHSLE